MTAQQKHKRFIRWRVAESNRLVSLGLPPDPWVIGFREKNNTTKASWKSRQPKSTWVPVANSGSFKKGMRPMKVMTPEQLMDSIIRKKAYQKKWNAENKDKVNAYKRRKKAESPSFKIACNLRKRLSFVLKANAIGKSKQTFQLLGCSIQEFMKHLESLFVSGMSFENYGLWHIDHKKPCASFDLTDPHQQAACFHYTNLQPLWATDNLVKNKRIK